ncbi:DeoR family transcriptional regulator [Suicoccus acidiformans]|uniref:DeoR family transcriptional regulator n=1 Tax=Suicoccus acidiformans TaxID=2036206 RepID=A0A347WIR2_9LACT|nr:DeoR/GlpR family DNA-binding transcription regulator [Suicoccus acidiformans]AXY24969.1 DeoR family transcriptional regulator [Suicoccus acidiformans]
MMNANDRRDLILQILREKKEIKIIELSEMINVSRETIRNDIKILENEDGRVKKTYGGAKLEESSRETAYEIRRQANRRGKLAIAKLASGLVEEGDTIYLDYGTTNLEIAKQLVAKNHLTVVTNTLPIINVLAKNETINLFVPGGYIRRVEFSLAGTTSMQAIQDIYVKYGFFGCSGIHMNYGITNIVDSEAEFSKMMMNRSTNVFIVADGTKFGRVSYKQLADFEEINKIITDQIPDSQKETVNFFKEFYPNLDVIQSDYRI